MCLRVDPRVRRDPKTLVPTQNRAPHTAIKRSYYIDRTVSGQRQSFELENSLTSVYLSDRFKQSRRRHISRYISIHLQIVHLDPDATNSLPRGFIIFTDDGGGSSRGCSRWQMVLFHPIMNGKNASSDSNKRLAKSRNAISSFNHRHRRERKNSSRVPNKRYYAMLTECTNLRIASSWQAFMPFSVTPRTSVYLIAHLENHPFWRVTKE